MTVKLQIVQQVEKIDLQIYKRNLRIEKLLLLVTNTLTILYLLPLLMDFYPKSRNTI